MKPPKDSSDCDLQRYILTALESQNEEAVIIALMAYIVLGSSKGFTENKKVRFNITRKISCDMAKSFLEKVFMLAKSKWNDRICSRKS